MTVPNIQQNFPFVVRLYSDLACTSLRGSGLLVGPRHVVSCAHVAEERPDAWFAKLCDERIIEVTRGDYLPQPRRAHEDLAIFELTDDACDVGAPIRYNFSREFWQPGRKHSLYALGHEDLIPTELGEFIGGGPIQDGQPLGKQAGGTIEGGYSGGPIVFHDQDRWWCVGIARRGGDGAATCSMITSDTLIKFLKQRQEQVQLAWFRLDSPQFCDDRHQSQMDEEVDVRQLIRVFVSSPDDVRAERDVLDHVVGAINRTDGERDSFRLQLFNWERNIVPQLGPSIRGAGDTPTSPCDIYLGIMSTRFGLPNERPGNGTEGEFEAALAKWKGVGEPWIMVYFDGAPKEIEDEQQAEQHLRVLRFSSKLKKLGLAAKYKGVQGGSETFRTQVDEHLRKVIRRLFEQAGLAPSSLRAPSPPAIPNGYLEGLQRECADIDLLGMRLKEGQALRLTNVYVPLVTTAVEELRRAKLESPSQEANERPQLLLDLFDDRSLYVSGPPGSGKSTFARWVAWLCCRGELPPRMLDEPEGYQERFPTALRGRLPLLVRLRDFWEALPKNAGCRELTLTQLESALARWLEVRKPGGLTWSCLEAHLRGGRALLIFDGVDEVPVSAGDDHQPWYPRAMLVSGLAEAVAAWNPCGNRLLVTSRPYGLTDPDRQRLGLHHAAISDLDDKLQRLLVRRWFGILADDAATGERQAGDFLEHVNERQDIGQLLANPMLLTAVCIVYNEGKRLPQDRHELYSRIVDNILYNRFRAPALIAMHRKQLCVIAHAMHTGEGLGDSRSTPRAEASLADLDQALASYQQRKLYTEEGFLGVTATREKLLSDSGLLLPRDGARAGFYHLSIQEHLAAQWLLEREEASLTRIFRQHSAAPEWRNTLSFVFGSLVAKTEEPTKAVQLLEGLLDEMAPDDVRLQVVIADGLQILLGRGIRLREPHQQLFCNACLAAIEREVALPDRHVLGLALGRLGDPRVITDLRDPAAYVRIEAGEYAYQKGKQLIDQPFLLSRYPVTNSQYELFVDAGGYSSRDYWSDDGWQWKNAGAIDRPRYWRQTRWNAPNQPVAGVSWWEAEAFCKWAGGQLPSERQWEAAARGAEGREYPWGDKWEDGICNSEEAKLGETSAVGLFPRSRSRELALEDMAGNVWDWCQDWYSEGVSRVIRGGGWIFSAVRCRSSYRGRLRPSGWSNDLGFRVARSSSVQ